MQFTEVRNYLRASPKRLTVCSDTDGFAADASNRLVPVHSDGPNNTRLSPCVLISFEPGIFNYLLAVPLSGQQHLQLHCHSINWDKEVTGLHFDSQLRQLLVAQSDRVTATDLGGRVSLQLEGDSLGLPDGDSFICDIAGSRDHILLLERTEPRVLLVSRRPQMGLQIRTIRLSSEPLLTGADLGSLAVSGGGDVFVSDNRSGRVFKLCLDSERLTEHSAGAADSPELCRIAADSRGHVIVSGFGSNSVAILNPDGSILQKLMLQFPTGAAVVESPDGVTFLVSDYGGRGLHAISLPFELPDKEMSTRTGSECLGDFSCRSSA